MYEKNTYPANYCRSTDVMLQSKTIGAKIGLLAAKRYGWLLVAAFFLLSFKKKENKSKKTFVITHVTKHGVRTKPVSQWVVLSIKDTVHILEKGVINRYIFVCTGQEYATPQLIDFSYPKVGDSLHVLK